MKLKFTKKNIKIISTVIVLIVSIFFYQSDSSKTLGISTSSEYAIVKDVIDGDTIILEDDRRVRYIGIDTPELPHGTVKLECFAKEATQKNKELVLGKKIKLEKVDLLFQMKKRKRYLPRPFWLHRNDAIINSTAHLI